MQYVRRIVRLGLPPLPGLRPVGDPRDPDQTAADLLLRRKFSRRDGQIKEIVALQKCRV
jgi:hypothetical protein